MQTNNAIKNFINALEAAPLLEKGHVGGDCHTVTTDQIKDLSREKNYWSIQYLFKGNRDKRNLFEITYARQSPPD